MDDNFPLELTFDDVLLEPRSSAVSRNAVGLETHLTKKIKLKIPILAAAMDTVSGAKMGIALGRLGGIAILHRNCSVAKQVAMLKAVKKARVLAGAAVGPGDLERALALDKAGADVIVVDTAHAHNLRTIASAKEIKKKIKAQIIVGNIATAEAARDLAKFADAIKVGIGPGSICTTRVVAGIGVPQLTAVMNVAAAVKKFKIPVIADGGMRYSGDVVKALAAGASSVMLGSMLAGTKEAPGRLIKIKGEYYKSYHGMGSLGVMQSGRSSDRYFQNPLFISPNRLYLTSLPEAQGMGAEGRRGRTVFPSSDLRSPSPARGEGENEESIARGRNLPAGEAGSGGYVPEGIEGIVRYKGPLKDVIEQITGGLRSGMGYIGAATIPEMWRQARFIRITNAGLRESHPHSITITKKAPNY